MQQAQLRLLIAEFILFQNRFGFRKHLRHQLRQEAIRDRPGGIERGTS